LAYWFTFDAALSVSLSPKTSHFFSQEGGSPPLVFGAKSSSVSGAAESWQLSVRRSRELDSS